MTREDDDNDDGSKHVSDGDGTTDRKITLQEDDDAAPVSAPVISIEAQSSPSESSVLLQINNVNSRECTVTGGEDSVSVGNPNAAAAANSSNSAFTTASDLSLPHRKIWVVTTASMPWRTGTSVNPLIRALYLTRNRPPNSVTLLIPWLDDAAARQQLYGERIIRTPHDQELWIRDYARTRCRCELEEPSLKIRFWKGSYNTGFGSIFPLEDICGLVPEHLADVAILEEPEHLNWFRVPSTTTTNTDSASTRSSSSSGARSGGGDNNNKGSSSTTDSAQVLGWAHKFTHVVGVLHTNYGAYIQQYGMTGTSFVTAPALNALSALVCKAYCHRIIRLSATLPQLYPSIEITCNVHGVRSEFLWSPPPPPEESPTTTSSTKDDESANEEDGDTKSSSNAPVYFIGKLIWAKGFDKVLELQEVYKELCGEYFSMDIYGGGDDMKAIQRGFFGRKGMMRTMMMNSDESYSPSNESTPNMTPSNSTGDLQARASCGDVFGQAASLRQQILVSDDKEDEPSTNNNTANSGEGGDDEDGNDDGNTTTNNNTSAGRASPSPLDIIGDIGGKTLNTGVETAGAAVKMIESIMEAGIGAFRNNSNNKNNDKDATTSSSLRKSRIVTPSFMFGPARSRFKWRQSPIPARFLGVQDHILVRDIPEQKVLLNMSITEVLCTTSAEALAMGKFVILPKHPSNEFFYDFPNCLAYENMEECVGKLQYALQNDAEPMTDKYKHMLSWEGATERLYEASGLTQEMTDELKASGGDKICTKAAQFHVNNARKSHFVSDLLSGRILKRAVSPVSPTNNPEAQVG